MLGIIVTAFWCLELHIRIDYVVDSQAFLDWHMSSLPYIVLYRFNRRVGCLTLTLSSKSNWLLVSSRQ